MPWSDDARVMTHPFATYGELAIAPDDRPLRAALGRVALLLFSIGAFVSFTTAGRLVAFHVASTMLFYAFVPAIQAAVLLAVVRLFAPRAELARALALYFTGHGPWLVFLLLLSAMCLFPPDVHAAFVWLLSHGILPGLLVVAWIWSGVLTYACFRVGVGLPRGRAGLATALFYAAYAGAVVSYYLLMNEIQPQVPWRA